MELFKTIEETKEYLAERNIDASYLDLMYDYSSGMPFLIDLLVEFDADEIKSMKRGKVLQNIHYVGDEYWEVCSQVGRS